MGFIDERKENKWNFLDCILKVRERESDLCVTYEKKPDSATSVQSKTDYLRYFDFAWGECLITVYDMYRTFYVYMDS